MRMLLPISLVFFLVLFIFSAPVLALSNTDFVKYVGKDVGLTQAYSEYQVCNPTAFDFYISSKAKQYFNWYFNEAIGNVKDYWFEVKLNRTYNYIVHNFTSICYPYSDGNGTASNCTLGDNPYEETRWGWNWERYNPIGATFKSNTCYNVRIYGTYDIGYGKIAIDNVLEFAGYSFTEYDWWNLSYNYKRNETINQTGSAALTNFPYLVNGSGGFNISTTPTQYVWSIANITATNTTKNYLYYNAYNDYRISNGSESIGLPFEIERGNGTSYNPNSTWNDNYLGVYHFGECSGSIFNDSTSYNTNGSISGTSTYQTGNIYGCNFRFDGSSTKGRINGGGILAQIGSSSGAGSQYAIEMWVNPSTANDLFMDKRTDSSSIYTLGVYLAGGKVQETTNNNACTGVASIGTGWHYIMISYNYSGGTTLNRRIYVNGTLDKECSVGGQVGSNNAMDLEIGFLNWAGYYSFGIDELRISNVSRSSDYALRNYQMGLARLNAEETPGAAAIATNISLYLNGTNSNMTQVWGNTLNATAKINVTGLFVELYRNDTLISNATTVSWNISAWPGGYYRVRAYYPGNATYTSNENILYANVTKVVSTLSLSSSAGWNIQQGTSTTLSCTASLGSASLASNGIGISNPYTATLISGTYAIACSVSPADLENYTYTPESNTLNVYTFATGCTNSSLYIYRTSINTTAQNISIDFTSLLSQSVVNSDLSDVYLETPNATSNVFLNSTHSIFIVNSTNVTSFVVNFGNVFASNSHTNISLRNSTMTPFSYSVLASTYYIVNMLNEINGSTIYPAPNASLSLSLSCSNGADSFNVTKPIMSIPTSQRLNSARATITYSPTSFYYRDLLVNSSIGYLNFYIIDAVEYQVVQMLMHLQDNTADFTSPNLRITKILGASEITITELAFDIEKKAVIYLQNGGTYNVYVAQGTNTRSIGGLFIDNVNLIKTIVLNPTVGIDIGIGEVIWNLTIDNTTGDISFNWYDSYANTKWINMSVYNYTNGQLLASFNSTNSTSIYFLYDGEVNQTYKVVLTVEHNLFSNHPWEYVKILSSFLASAILPIISFPQLPVAFLWFAGFIGILTIPMFFDERNGALAGIFAVLGAGLFAFLGWYTVSIAILAVLIVLAILNMIASNRKRRGAVE